MSAIFITLSKVSPNLEILDVLEDREKSFKVRNRDNGAVCFVPKSGLKPLVPEDSSRNDEFVLSPWFRGKLNRHQERALGVLE